MATVGFPNTIDVLKDHYGQVFPTINNEFFLLSVLEQDTEHIETGGQRAVHLAHVGRSSGVGVMNPSTLAFPTAGRQSYARVFVPMRRPTGSIEISGPMMDAAERGDPVAFLDPLDKEMDGAFNDSRQDISRQCYGTSDGVIAGLATNGSGTTLDLAEGTTETELLHLGDQNPTDNGTVIDIGTASDPDSVAGGRTIEGFGGSGTSADPYTIDISGSGVATTSGTDFIFRAGAGGESDGSGTWDDGQLELTGLQTLADDTATAHGIDPAEYPRWAALVEGNDGDLRPWNELLMANTMARANARSGEGTDFAVGNWRVVNAAANKLSQKGRIINTVQLEGGWTGIEFSSVMNGNSGSQTCAIVSDFSAPEHKLFGIPKSAMCVHVERQWGWVERGGSPLLQQVSDADTSYDKWRAHFMASMDIAAKARNALWRIDDLAQS